MDKSVLDKIMCPKSIAVVGASTKEHTIGSDIMKRLQEYKFNGKIYPINPKGGIIEGLQAYTTVNEVPGDIDGGNGEREHPTLGIPLQHDGAEGLVEEVHLLLEVSVGLVHVFPADDNGLLSQRPGHLDVKGQVGKGALEAHTGRHVDVEHELLQALFDLVEGHVIVMDEGGAVGVE